MNIKSGDVDIKDPLQIRISLVFIENNDQLYVDLCLPKAI